MDPRPISLFDVVKRACDIVDPDDDDAVIGDFERAFEDDDEPVAGLDVEERVGEVLAQLDPAVNNGSLAVAAALTVYLSFRRDELHRTRESSSSSPCAPSGRANRPSPSSSGSTTAT